MWTTLPLGMIPVLYFASGVRYDLALVLVAAVLPFFVGCDEMFSSSTINEGSIAALFWFTFFAVGKNAESVYGFE